MGMIKMKDKNIETKRIVLSESKVAAEIDKTKEMLQVENSNAMLREAGVLHEEKSLRSTFSKCWEMNNGTMRQVISSNALHYADKNGTMQEIDNSLTEKENGFEANVGGRKISFAKDANAGNIKIEKEGMRLSWKPIKTKTPENTSALRIKSAVVPVGIGAIANANKEVLYENISDNADLEYSLMGSNVKENIIVKERKEDYRYEFEMEIVGLNVRLSEDNRSIDLINVQTDEREYTIPEPFMYDATGEKNNEVYYEIEKIDENKYLFAVVAESGWINAPERALPVIIDPQLVMNQSNLFSYKVWKTACSTLNVSSVNCNYIKVDNSDIFETYYSTLTINKKNFPLVGQKISKVTMTLTPHNVSKSGNISIGNKTYFCQENKKINADITQEFNSADEVLQLSVCALGNVKAEIECDGAAAPEFIMEYIKDYTKPCKKRYALVGGANGIFNVPIGELVTEIPATSSTGLSIDYGISLIHKSSDAYFGCGNDFRLNLYEKLEKNSDDKIEAHYIYTDPYGDKYEFDEYFYYITDNDEKITVKKENVTVNIDETLTDNYGHKVQKEERSATGLRAIIRLEGVKNVEWIEQRQAEEKQLEEQYKAYEQAGGVCGVVDSNSGTVLKCHEKFEDNNEAFDNFIKLAKKENNLLLFENEIFSFSSICESLNNSDNLTAEQISSLHYQKSVFKSKKYSNIEQFTRYRKEYLNKKYEYEQYRKYTPVDYLTDESIIKGFNYKGELVAVCDNYENIIMIERDNDRITRVYDNKNNQISFKYNNGGILRSITDARGRITELAYDATANNLIKITYPNKKTLEISYNNSYISKISSSDMIQSEMAYSGNRFAGLKIASCVNKFGRFDCELCFDNPQIVTEYLIEYGESRTVDIITDNKYIERYRFNEKGNLTEYYSEENKVVTKAEQYDFVKYEKDNVKSAKKSTLYKRSLSDFEFIAESIIEVDLNKFNNPIQKRVFVDSQAFDSTKTNYNTVIDYTYDDNQLLIGEQTTVTTIYPDNSNSKTHTVITTYNYNAQGSVVRTESYVVNEELTNGKTIKETVYDEKGNVVKSFIYNSLDSSSKFYTESEYAEDGKVTAEIDETGENKTNLEYIDGTSVVRSKTLPNGSKFAYGHDENDTVTAITQSTEEGEENSTQTAYTAGEATELRSGNNVVNYSYDYKRRKIAIDLNGTKEYVKFAYADKATEDGKTVNKSTATYVKRNSDTQDIFETVTDMHGNVLKTKYNGEAQVSYTYDTDNKITALNDKISNAYSWEYDALDRVTSYSGGGVAENYTYNFDGNTETKTVTVDGKSTKYKFGYKGDAAKELKYTEITDSIESASQTDVLGRHTGKVLSTVRYENNGEKRLTDKFFEESIAYRKVGDHATNMPSVMRFGEKRNGQYVLLDNLKYKYDKCGNISEVIENGKLAAKYTYDKLNRLVREDNKPFGKTWLYSYDNNGNILNKREFAFTLKDTVLLEESTDLQDVQYAYDGDKLMRRTSKQGNPTETENFVYDALGNPTNYLGKICTWAKGRQLKSYNGVTFEYNGQGQRISKTANGEITHFTYDSNGNLLKQVNGAHTLEFLYDNCGLMGVIYTTSTETKRCFYRRNAQGDIIALLDNSGIVVVKYNYNAWGNHSEATVLDSAYTELSQLNPFRYRGYYYDTETKLYFLKTRYYDSEVGRWLNIDNINIVMLGSGIIGGINGYSYCFNDPVNYVDFGGFFPQKNDWKVLHKNLKYRFDDRLIPQKAHIHVKYQNKEFSWYMLGHNPHDKLPGLNELPNSVKKKLKEAGVPNEYFNSTFVFLPPFREGFSIVDLPRWQEGFSLIDYSGRQETFNFVNPPKVQESFTIVEKPSYNEGFSIPEPDPVVVAGLVAVGVIAIGAFIILTGGWGALAFI